MIVDVEWTFSGPGADRERTGVAGSVVGSVPGGISFSGNPLAA